MIEPLVYPVLTKLSKTNRDGMLCSLQHAIVFTVTAHKDARPSFTTVPMKPSYLEEEPRPKTGKYVHQTWYTELPPQAECSAGGSAGRQSFPISTYLMLLEYMLPDEDGWNAKAPPLVVEVGAGYGACMVACIKVGLFTLFLSLI